MPRYRSEALQAESRLADAAHDLWVCFHRGSRESFRVPREALAIVLSHSKIEAGRVLAGDPPKRARQVEVYRSGLWELLTGNSLIKREWNLE